MHTLIVAGACILLLALVWLTAGRVWVKYAGARVITCPENQRPAGVRVDAKRAALSLSGKEQLQLESCSRWPEMQNCGQQCLREIAAAPDECLVRNIVAQWYAGKDCAYCGKPIKALWVAGNQPALMGPDGKTMEWPRVAADKIPEVLKTYLPVCWPCHLTNTFVAQHPELVVDRSVKS